MLFLISAILLNSNLHTVNCQTTTINCAKNIENPECGSETVTCYDYYMKGNTKSDYYKLRITDKYKKSVYPVVWCDMTNRQTVVHNSMSYHDQFAQLKGKNVSKDSSFSIQLKYGLDWYQLKLLMDASENCSQSLRIVCDKQLKIYGIGPDNEDMIIRSINEPSKYSPLINEKNYPCDNTEKVITLSNNDAGVYAIGVKDPAVQNGYFKIKTGSLMCTGKKYSTKGCHFKFLQPDSYLTHSLEIKEQISKVSMYFRTRLARTNLIYFFDSSNKQALMLSLSEGRILEIFINDRTSQQIFLQSHKSDNQWHFISFEQQKSGQLKVQVDFEHYHVKNVFLSTHLRSININLEINNQQYPLPIFQGCIYNLTVNDDIICQTKTNNVGKESCLDATITENIERNCYKFEGKKEKNFIFVILPSTLYNNLTKYSFYFSTYQEKAFLLYSHQTETGGNKVPFSVQIELEYSDTLSAWACLNKFCQTCSILDKAGFNNDKKHFVGFFTYDNRQYLAVDESFCELKNPAAYSRVTRGNHDKKDKRSVFFGGLHGSLNIVDDPVTFYHSSDFKSLSLKGTMSDIYIDGVILPVDDVISVYMDDQINVRKDECLECYCDDNVPCYTDGLKQKCDCASRFMSVEKTNEKKCMKTDGCFELNANVKSNFIFNVTAPKFSINPFKAYLIDTIQFRQLWIAFQLRMSQHSLNEEFLLSASFKFEIKICYEQQFGTRLGYPKAASRSLDHSQKIVNISSLNITTSEITLKRFTEIGMECNKPVKFDFTVQFDKTIDNYDLPEFYYFQMMDFDGIHHVCTFSSIFALDKISVATAANEEIDRQIKLIVTNPIEYGSYPPPLIELNGLMDNSDISETPLVLILIIVAVVCLIILLAVITICIIQQKKQRNNYPVKHIGKPKRNSKRKAPEGPLEPDEDVPIRYVPNKAYRDIQANFEERVPLPEASDQQTRYNTGDFDWSPAVKHASSIDEGFRDLQRDLAKTPPPKAKAQISRISELFDDDNV